MENTILWGDFIVTPESVGYLEKIRSAKCLGLPPVAVIELDDSPESYTIWRGMMNVIFNVGGFAANSYGEITHKLGDFHGGRWVFYVEF